MKSENNASYTEQLSAPYIAAESQIRIDNSKKHMAVLIGTIVLMLTSIYCLVQLQPFYEAVMQARMASTLGQVFTYAASILLGLQILFLVYLAVQYFRYKPVESVADDALPTCTIIIPAYNEGRLVYATLQSITQSDYPTDKMDIWAIDDGSTDDTWFWIERARNDFGAHIHIHQQPQNMGKRHALYHGFHAGTGEIFITIDSDSIIEKDTIRNMVSPFVLQEDCGAVAGNVKVLNKTEGFIPRMLNVSFKFSFEFVRSAQSALGFVLCTPGALSAYRKKAVMPILDQWLHQSFAGQAATIGEDRAMTNMILAQGYDVKFQKNAIVHTNTPITFKTLHKMFTRWGRSNVRESLMMNAFIFKSFRKKSLAGARILYAYQWLNILMAIPLTLLMVYFFVSDPFIYICSAIVGASIFSSIQMVFYAYRNRLTEALWAYPYSIFYMFTLFWIAPYSILTIKNGGWLTR